MKLALESPWLWPLLVMGLLPLFHSPVSGFATPWNELLPADVPSRLWSVTIRCAGAIAITGLILGIAGLHRP